MVPLSSVSHFLNSASRASSEGISGLSGCSANASFIASVNSFMSSVPLPSVSIASKLALSCTFSSSVSSAVSVLSALASVDASAVASPPLMLDALASIASSASVRSAPHTPPWLLLFPMVKSVVCVVETGREEGVGGW